MKLITFDLGANLAICHNVYGTDDVRVAVETFKGDRVQRAADTLTFIETSIARLGDLGPIDAVVYERPFARGQDATRSLWGIAGLIEAAAARAGILVIDISPSEIKKFTAGTGKASKEDMILFASMTGYQGENEHEADAWCLLRMAEQTLKPQRVKKDKRRG